ncbi:MAG: DUF2784 domain-containing protein [Kiritimatiellia bacterium]|nr:DUF2784 domain-containing protein [Kiritimatiellia bacterium]MDP6848596.1 DUF2784 domain-containing protein [Kiritimatiellia bacterium]
MHSLTADGILVAHFLFIAFVLGGQGCIVVGYFRNWHWIRSFLFRVCHILAIAVVIAQTWADKLCPLTTWENALRKTAGEPTYTETFVQHWLGRLIYYDAPAWVFTLVYSIFGAVVLLSWIWIKPERNPSGNILIPESRG